MSFSDIFPDAELTLPSYGLPTLPVARKKSANQMTGISNSHNVGMAKPMCRMGSLSVVRTHHPVTAVATHPTRPRPCTTRTIAARF